MYRIVFSFIAAVALLSATANAGTLPTTWVDKDTGHRVIRLTDEPGSSGFYFNVNAYTPDGRKMAYITAERSDALPLSKAINYVDANAQQAGKFVIAQAKYGGIWRTHLPSTSTTTTTR